MLSAVNEEKEVFFLAAERLRRSLSVPSPKVARLGDRSIQDSFGTENDTDIWASVEQSFTPTRIARVQDRAYPSIPQKRKASGDSHDYALASTENQICSTAEHSKQTQSTDVKTETNSMSLIVDLDVEPQKATLQDI